MSDLVTLIVQLEADDDLDGHERARRDRRIGRELAHLRADPAAQIRGWLARIANDAARRRGAAAENGRRLIGLIVFALGLSVGCGAALGVFHYDGRHPVNVTNVLVVFVGIQAIVLALFVLTCLPSPTLRSLPGVAGLSDALSSLNPGRWGLWLSRYLPVTQREALRSLTANESSLGQALGPPRRWCLARWSQGFAVAFNTGALASALFLVTVSDLAFGWSTTLDISAETFHGFVGGLSFPWRAWLPAAVPSVDLVDMTRYFRLDSGLLPNAEPGADPALMGTWWRFLAMCMITYGLFPRLLTWGYCAIRSRQATSRAMTRVPGAPELIERLNMPVIETSATVAETHGRQSDAPKPCTGEHRRVERPYVVIDWANTRGAEPGVESWLGSIGAHVHAAGGAQTLDADTELVEHIGRQRGQETIVIMVKAWEPPLMEFLDFVTELRRAVGDRRRIAVIPIGPYTAGRPRSARAEDFETWNRQIARLSDPDTFVQHLPTDD